MAAYAAACVLGALSGVAFAALLQRAPAALACLAPVAIFLAAAPLFAGLELVFFASFAALTLAGLAWTRLS